MMYTEAGLFIYQVFFFYNTKLQTFSFEIVTVIHKGIKISDKLSINFVKIDQIKKDFIVIKIYEANIKFRNQFYRKLPLQSSCHYSRYWSPERQTC